MFLSSVAAVVAATVLSSCAPDPYNLHAQAYRIEKLISGPAALEREEPVEHRQQFVLLESNRIPNGGIYYKVFRLDDMDITPDLGNSLLARKARYGEVFGLLTKGAIGEGSDGRLVPRVSSVELTKSEQQLIAAENRDRDYLIEAAMSARQVPAYEIAVVRGVFAYARYQMLPEGVWVEIEPGKWIVKGGQGYVRRVMGRAPVLLESDDVLSSERAENVGAEEPKPSDPETWPEKESAVVADEAVVDEPKPYVIEEPTPEIRTEEPAGDSADLEEPQPTVR